MAAPALCEDTLYLGCHDNDGDDLSLDSQVTLFLHTFCQLTSAECKVCFVKLPQKGDEAVRIRTRFRLPESLKHVEVMDEVNIPMSVRHCALPVLLLRNEFSSCCCLGLANIVRNLLYKGDKEHPERNLTNLLGYNQTCLKACAESSQWTKLCEIEMPSAIDDFLRTGHHGDIHPTIKKFESFLAQPVAMSNINKKRREVHKRSVAENCIGCQNNRTQSTGDCGCLELEKNRKSTSSSADDVVDAAVRIQTMQIADVGTADGISMATDNIDDGYIANDDENCQDRTQLRAQRRKRRLKKPRSKQVIPTESLPTLPHLFAEGFEVTLADLVLYPCLYHYIAHTIQNNVPDIQEKIPRVFRWYKNMLAVPYVTEASELCGLTPLIVRDLEPDCQQEEPIELQSEENLKLQKLKSRKVIKTALKREAPGLVDKLACNRIETAFRKHPCENLELEWNSFPEDVKPIQGDVTDERCVRKCHQVENIVSAVLPMAKPGNVIVDFCCGAGHVGITLAYLLPQCHVFLIENKIESLERAQSRIASLQMKNVTLYHGNLEYFQGSFDIGVSLHACGVATDMVLSKCIGCKAAFISSPCCYGSVRNTHTITYPRSKTFKQVLSEEEYVLLGHAADQTPWQFESDTAKQGKKCMGLIDEDRAEAAREHGYQVTICTIQPPSSTPKNNLLIGVLPRS